MTGNDQYHGVKANISGSDFSQNTYKLIAHLGLYCRISYLRGESSVLVYEHNWDNFLCILLNLRVESK
jgi:hypothetical protein